MKPKRLSPSILAADFAFLCKEMEKARGADYIHVDVMDGQFVPNITIGPPVVRRLKTCSPLPFDVHLMIDRPSRFVRAFLDAGADILTLHVESDTQNNLWRAITDIRAFGARPSITLRPNTPLEELTPYLPLVDMVLVMTVEPGFGGQDLLPNSLSKVQKARAMLDAVNPACELEVDGGVTLENVERLARAGANVFVAGSAVFGAPDVEKRIEEFKKHFRDDPKRKE